MTIIFCMFVIQMISDLLNLMRVITTMDDDCGTILLDLVNVAIMLDLSDGYICDVPLDTVTAPGQVGAATFKNVVPPPGNCCKFLMKRGITMDSGAGDNVFPNRMVSTRRIRISPGQRQGLHYVGPTSHRIPNLGEVDLDFMTLEGHDESWVCQIADVNKPLGAISDRVDHNCC